MKFLKIHPQVQTSDRQIIQEYYKERFYWWITLLALNSTILFSDTLISPERAFFIIFVTVIGLWWASLFSAIISHRIVHMEEEKQDQEISESFTTHKWIIISWLPTLSFVSLSILGFIGLSFALTLAISLGIVRMFITVLDAFTKNDRHFFTNSVSIVLQILVLLFIITLKFLSEK